MVSVFGGRDSFVGESRTFADGSIVIAAEASFLWFLYVSLISLLRAVFCVLTFTFDGV